jgi:hypothetical protein
MAFTKTDHFAAHLLLALCLRHTGQNESSAHNLRKPIALSNLHKAILRAMAQYR